MKFLLAALSLACVAAGPISAAQDAAPAAADTAQIAAGRALFLTARCGDCHALKDAQTLGRVGPPLDGAAHLTAALVVERVTNGSGPMPDFSERLTEAEIAAVAAYVDHAAVR